MRNLKLTLSILIAAFFIKFTNAQDWANLKRFQTENKELALPKKGEHRIVFMGNSITEGWLKIHPEFFENKSYINRGISGQTTPQMLLRFRQDVINLKPSVVIILAGINDIAGNTGPSTIEMITDNIISMAELAKANNIKVIICSVLPALEFPWKKGLNPAKKIIKLNEQLKLYVDKKNLIYLDYYSSMVDSSLGLKKELSEDGVHPNLAGYLIMEPLLEKALKKTIE